MEGDSGSGQTQASCMYLATAPSNFLSGTTLTRFDLQQGGVNIKILYTGSNSGVNQGGRLIFEGLSSIRGLVLEIHQL
jgi:hypothetical protein